MATGRQKRELLMSVDAAELLGVPVRGVQRLAAKGTLKTVAETPRGYRLFAREEVERVAKARRKNPPKIGRPRKASTQKTKTRKVKNKEG